MDGAVPHIPLFVPEMVGCFFAKPFGKRRPNCQRSFSAVLVCALQVLEYKGSDVTSRLCHRLEMAVRVGDVGPEAIRRDPSVTFNVKFIGVIICFYTEISLRICPFVSPVWALTL